MLQILIADVHEIVRRGLKAVVEQHSGWHVSGETSNGREAVKLALKTAPDVVLLDLFMPELNGVEATRAIKKELPNTEVLIFTVHEAEDLVRDEAPPTDGTRSSGSHARWNGTPTSISKKGCAGSEGVSSLVVRHHGCGASPMKNVRLLRRRRALRTEALDLGGGASAALDLQ